MRKSYKFRLHLTKEQGAGKYVELVNPYNTSQKCSICGNIVPKGLSIRVHKCPKCGIELDRDVNAAINIQNICTLGTTERACGVTDVGMGKQKTTCFNRW
ncbi:transposase [Methanococcoides sp.]|uniref:transposase n=1 Tax=Methanococcoides sp. TaxID=1966350 RepID=UPI00272DFFDA|nr:transposase [Methanococcoides sp.]